MRVRGLKMAIRRHVENAVARLDPKRYRQEAAYVAALFARLDAVVLERRDARLEFRSTIVADRGPNSAESIWGADFGVTATLAEPESRQQKAVIGQAKRGSITSLPARESQLFRKQVAKMGLVMSATIALEVPDMAGAVPLVRIVEATSTFGETWAAQSICAPRASIEKTIRPADAAGGRAALIWPSMRLDDYLCDQVVACFHGDRDLAVVRALEDSRLTSLHIDARKGV